ncbi:MAG: 1-deoxy-D-xylulose-5-phosphate synthase [Candidatus Acidiferrales bacterium]
MGTPCDGDCVDEEDADYVHRAENQCPRRPARIGRVTFSNSGKSLYYRGREFASLDGAGFKANYFDCETYEQYWISGCKRRGGDRLYSGTIEIDEDVREEYWTEIRKLPDRKKERVIHCEGKHSL